MSAIAVPLGLGAIGGGIFGLSRLVKQKLPPPPTLESEAARLAAAERAARRRAGGGFQATVLTRQDGRQGTVGVPTLVGVR